MPTMIDVVCSCCEKHFNRSLKDYNHHIKDKSKHTFCSLECSGKYKSKTRTKSVICKQCNKEFKKSDCEIKKHPNNFCSQSCAATYNNTHKTHGTRRSKLEVWLEKQLIILYPNVEFHFNKKDTINSELDIYIPSLKLAFELNGIYHYEPIHGEKKLASIQNNDSRKFAACLESGISLCIIDVSSFTYFKIEGAKKYLDIITNIVDNYDKS